MCDVLVMLSFFTAMVQKYKVTQMSKLTVAEAHTWGSVCYLALLTTVYIACWCERLAHGVEEFTRSWQSVNTTVSYGSQETSHTVPFTIVAAQIPDYYLVKCLLLLLFSKPVNTSLLKMAGNVAWDFILGYGHFGLVSSANSVGWGLGYKVYGTANFEV